MNAGGLDAGFTLREAEVRNGSVGERRGRVCSFGEVLSGAACGL